MEACRRQNLTLTKLLISRGATLKGSLSRAVLFTRNRECVVWLLSQHKPGSFELDPWTLETLLETMPDLALAYLDLAGKVTGGDEYGSDLLQMEFFGLRFLYGQPTHRVSSTALAIAV